MDRNISVPNPDRLNPDLIPVVPPGIAFRIIAGEAVIINPKTAMIYTLNPTGSLAWQLMDGKNTLKEIAREIESQYQTTSSQAEHDLGQLLSELKSRELIAWKNPGT